MVFETGIAARPGIIPVFARSLGSWHIAIGRRAFQPAELEAHYDRAADVWDCKVNRLGFDAAYRDLIRRALPQSVRARARQPLCVLDAGIGTGALSSALTDGVQRDVHLTGIDLSPAMLDQARRRLHDRCADLDLRRADLTELPFADGRFDVVLMGHVLEHLPDPDAALAEIHRVLKPGGHCVACITRPSRLGAYIQLVWRTHRVAEGLALGWLARAGFDGLRTLQLAGGPLPQRYSIGYVARKPDA